MSWAAVLLSTVDVETEAFLLGYVSITSQSCTYMDKAKNSGFLYIYIYEKSVCV